MLEWIDSTGTSNAEGTEGYAVWVARWRDDKWFWCVSALTAPEILAKGFSNTRSDAKAAATEAYVDIAGLREEDE